MKLREGPSDALSDEIIGSDRIARQTSRIPPKLGEVGFDASVQNGGRNRGPLLKAGLSLGIGATVVSRPGISLLLLIASL